MKPKMWSPTDPKHFEGKSVAELQNNLKRANEFVEEHEDFRFGWHNEYRHELKRRIAEKIGAK